VGIKENASQKFNNIFLYPNPGNNTIYLNLSPEFFKETKTEFTIINSVGQICKSGPLTSNAIQVSDLSEGMYFINLETEGARTTLKFVKN
jgi:hypothetical protein